MMKGRYEKPTAHVTVIGEDMPKQSAEKQEQDDRAALTNSSRHCTVLVLARTFKQQKEIKSSRLERRKTLSIHR